MPGIVSRTTVAMGNSPLGQGTITVLLGGTVTVVRVLTVQENGAKSTITWYVQVVLLVMDWLALTVVNASKQQRVSVMVTRFFIMHII